MTGAAALLSSLPPVKPFWLTGYDADCFRTALADLEIKACIPSRSASKIIAVMAALRLLAISESTLAIQASNLIGPERRSLF